MPRKIKNSKKNTRNMFFIKQKLKHEKAKKWEEEVQEYLNSEQQESKITDPNPNESYINNKNQECYVVNGPLSNPGRIHDFAKLTGTTENDKRFVIPITMQLPKDTKTPEEEQKVIQTKPETTNQDTAEKPIEQKPTETIMEDEVPEENLTAKTTIQTKQGIRAITQCEYKAPRPANTDITEILQAINTLTKALKNTKNEQNKLRDAIHNCDLETCDLLHEIELNEYEEAEEHSLYEKLKEVRQRRRTYKIKYTYIEELNIFNNSLPTLQTRLVNLHKKLSEIQEKHNSSKYAPRIRTDIKESDKIKYIARQKVN